MFHSFGALKDCEEAASILLRVPAHSVTSTAVEASQNIACMHATTDGSTWICCVCVTVNVRQCQLSFAVLHCACKQHIPSLAARTFGPCLLYLWVGALQSYARSNGARCSHLSNTTCAWQGTFPFALMTYCQLLIILAVAFFQQKSNLSEW